MNKDGVDHINVYSRGETELGRLLSNFANTPFFLDPYMFASVEAWWYWRKAKAEGVVETKLDRLRTLSGFVAKDFGNTLVTQNHPDPARAELLRVYQAKCDQHPRIAAMLRDNKLPFDHYYVYKGKRVDTRHAWTGKLWSEVKP